MDDEGHLLPVKDWPPEIRAAVASMEITKRNLTAGDDVQEDVVKLKLWDKIRAVELLAKHLGLLIERINVSGDEELLKKLDEGRRRNAEASKQPR